jgi:hypothetical protein
MEDQATRPPAAEAQSQTTNTSTDAEHEVKTVGIANSVGRVVRNVGVLDLTGLDGPEALDGVTSISTVGVILVPQPLLAKLGTIPMSKVGSTIPVPAGARPRMFTGDVILSGDALENADGTPDDVLIVTGDLILTSPVRKVGYSAFIFTGDLVAPQGSDAALASSLTRMTGDLTYYPYTEGSTVRVLSGAQRLSGSALANASGQETDILLVAGPLIVTSPIERLGYQHLVVLGTFLVPPGSDDALLGRVTAIGGGIITYTAPPKIFSGNNEFSGAFFEYLDDPITLVLDGNSTFDEDVTAEVMKPKVAGIVINGNVMAPRSVVPLIQALALAQHGNIRSIDNPRARSRDDDRA